MQTAVTKPRIHATYGAASANGTPGVLPTPFPRTMGPNCAQYLQEVLDSGMTVDMMGRFEKAFAAALGVKHCIATPGCTPALGVLAAALPFDPGDEIILSPITDFGTIQGLCLENLIPVFADTEPGTVNVSAQTIEPCITDRTRAILVVHKTGIICDMDPINELAQRHGLFVYEDVCQAVFGRYKGRVTGTLGQAAAFSFDPEKTMGADTGGCIVTNDDEMAERMRFIGHSRGGEMVPHFGRVHAELGYAYRMPQCTAAISLGQLEIIDEQVAQRDRMVRLLTSLSRSKFGVFGDFQSRLQGFWSHLFRFRLQKTTYFISENRPNLGVVHFSWIDRFTLLETERTFIFSDFAGSQRENGLI
ncbi:DegT/DnrJ/EryC1/StrS family aminotransferase [Chloroflexi bacterium TSY]|nr:DegT/DnrJ/EryC1/StrS family aminotransferase [Chloroflexi bacterium TSY]